MRTLFNVALSAVILVVLVCCTTSGGKRATVTPGIGPMRDRPVVLLEMFMDTRPFQEQRGRSESSLTIETTDRDFSAKPHVSVERALKASMTQQGIVVFDRGAGQAPLILSGEIRHFHGQIRLTRLPGAKRTTTSSFLPANFHATVQVLATLFDSQEQRVLFRQSFVANRDKRHSMSETTPREAKRRLVALVEECLREVASAVARKTHSQIRSSGQRTNQSP